MDEIEREICLKLIEQCDQDELKRVTSFEASINGQGSGPVCC